MGFQFKLEKVLQHRKLIESLAQRDLQIELASLSKLINELEHMEKLRHEAFQELDASRAKGQQTQLPSILQAIDFIKGQDKRIENQKIKVQEQEKLVESKREILREKAVEFKIIDKLKERRKNEYLYELNMKEQKELDDLNTTRFELKENE